MKKYFSIFLSILFISKILVLNSCANIIPPDGGPKDTIAPILIKAIPIDSVTGFNSNKITLTFNEYVVLDNNWSQNVIVSPNPLTMPYIESKLQNVTVKLKDTLLPNTTYAINFGNSIKDVNESNPYKEFTYVFSTGSSIASGKITGKVLMAETGIVDSSLIAVLQNNLNDSAIKKIKPLYYTKINGKGNFTFNWLPAGKYNVFILPNDYSKKYDDSTKVFAFLNEPIKVDTTNPAVVSMLAYHEFNKEESKTNFNIPPQIDKKRKVDTAEKIKYSTNLENGKQSLLDDFEINLITRIKDFDSSKITLTDTNYKEIKNYSIKSDSVLNNIFLSYPWKEESTFKLIINNEAFKDSMGNYLTTNDTISFITKAAKEYGSLRLQFKNIELSKNPVLQIVSSSKVVDNIPVVGGEIYKKLYLPGEYELRILYDLNNNGIWDPGDYKKKLQPEQVISIPKKLTIKANWDNEVNINL